MRLREQYKTAYNNGTKELKDSRVRVVVATPKRCANGDPTLYVEPFMDRTHIDNPFQCGYANGSLPMNYMIDYETFNIKSDKMYNTTAGG